MWTDTHMHTTPAYKYIHERETKKCSNVEGFSNGTVVVNSFVWFESLKECPLTLPCGDF